jgi:hypothetical protein
MPKAAQEPSNHTALIPEESAVRVFVEQGRLRVVGEIPVVSNKAELEAFVSEINVKLLGDNKKPRRPSFALLTKELTEAEAAIYIGHSKSFLKKCRIYGGAGGHTRGPKFTRDTKRCIRYPIEELDKWLANRTRYETNCEAAGLAYKLAASRGLLPGAAVFLPEHHTFMEATALYFLMPLGASLPFGIFWSKDTRRKAVCLVLAFLAAYALPPISLIGIINPLMASGAIFRGWGVCRYSRRAGDLHVSRPQARGHEL